MQKSTAKATKRKAPQVIKKEQPETEQSTIKLKLIELKPDALEQQLPDVLSSWIEGEKPKNIYHFESPEKGTGFNVTAWQDQKGSKLYLENLDPWGLVDPGLKSTLYPQVQNLARKSRWEYPLSDTIFVKSAGDSKSKMAVKKMVLWLLNTYQSNSELPNEPILKETKTDLVGKESVITFSVKGITQIEPIMSPYSLSISDSRLAQTLVAALNSYRRILSAGVVNGFRIEQVVTNKGGTKEARDARKTAQDMLDGIVTAATILQSTLENEIKNQKQTNLSKKDVATLETLLEQVNSAMKDNFNNELDTRRWQQWNTLKPLTEDNIVPGTGKEIGKGVQGPVSRFELDPALGRDPVVVKYDRNGLNEDALGAGIPELNPQQSVRAVTAFKMSDKLQLDVIPRTDFFVGTDVNGRPELGQTMEFVTGAVGQRKAGVKNDAFSGTKAQHLNDLLKIVNRVVPSKDEEWSSARQELLQYHYDPQNDLFYSKPPIDKMIIDNLENDQITVAKLGQVDPESLDKKQQNMLEGAQQELDKYVKVNGQWYHAEIVPADVTYDDPFVQKGLSDLQVFDYIIGHADRNPGNWIYVKDNNGRIIGVKGIDNDDILGKAWAPGSSAKPKILGEFSSKTPDIPPIVDISTALSILKANFNTDIRPLLTGLSDDEINTAAERFDEVQQKVEGRVMAGKIASIAPSGDVGVQAQLEELGKLTGFPDRLGQLRWGNLGNADTHTAENSYLGFQITQKQMWENVVNPSAGDPYGLVQLRV